MVSFHVKICVDGEAEWELAGRFDEDDGAAHSGSSGRSASTAASSSLGAVGLTILLNTHGQVVKMVPKDGHLGGMDTKG